MVFSSIIFLLYFLPTFFLLYFLVGMLEKDTQARNLLTLVFSIAFYAWGAPVMVYVVVGTTLADFYLVRLLHQSQAPRRRMVLLLLAILLNISLLFYFKYANFFVENVNRFLHLLGADGVHWTKIALPIGISFFTFQKLTYSIDVYRGTHAPLRNPLDYLLYILMFPQLIAGPIVRFHSVAEQLKNRRATDVQRLTGFYRFVIGLSKKVLIANVLAAQADEIMGLPVASLDSTLAWIGILAYTFQIYFDFAGYSDMAIGIGRMIGFRFPENFDNPYVSGSITEFWRRWHITLGAWMRDYLYIPLGGNRVKRRSRLYFNLWVVFLLSGLWHGASWNFVLWGAWHGAFLVLDRLVLNEILHKVPRFIRVGGTFLVVVLGWVLFRLSGLGQAVGYYKRLFTFDFGEFAWGLHLEFLCIFGLAVGFSFVTLTGWGKRLQKAVYAEDFSIVRSSILLVLVVLLFILSLAAITGFGFNPFIYFRF